VFDEADDRQRRATIDPWMVEIPCRRGVIYLYGGNRLAVMVDGRPKLAGELRRMACCRVVQDGETETSFLFDLQHFAEVAAVVSAKVSGPVTDALCAHAAGPPTCWCRPPLPGLPLTFARAHGIDPSSSIVIGTGPAHRTLANALGAWYVQV
jgi:hypothetical protein